MSGRRGRGGRAGGNGRGGSFAGRGSVAGGRRVVVAQPNVTVSAKQAAAAPKTLDQRFSLLAQRRLEQTERVSANRFSNVMAKRTGTPRAQVVAAAVPITQRGGRGRKGAVRGAARTARGRGTAVPARPIALARTTPARPTAPRGGRTGRGTGKGTASTGRGRGRGTAPARGRGKGSAGGRGKGGKGKTEEKLSQEQLDDDLENYMAGGASEAPTDMES